MSACLRTIELKPFVPAKDFVLSKNFFRDMASPWRRTATASPTSTTKMAPSCLQDFYTKELAENLHTSLARRRRRRRPTTDPDVRTKAFTAYGQAGCLPGNQKSAPRINARSAPTPL